MESIAENSSTQITAAIILRIVEMSVRFGIDLLFDSVHLINPVIPTKSDDSLCESSGAWRDLLSAGSSGAASKQQVPRLRRSSASRAIFFARDDRLFNIAGSG
jgi:hypothetical protein